MSPRRVDEVVCWMLALMLHSLLLFWQASPYSKAVRSAIVSIDYIMEEIGPSPLSVHPEKRAKSFAEKVKRFFRRPKTVKKEKEGLLADRIGTTLKPISVTKKVSKPRKKLVSKKGTVSNFGVKEKKDYQPEFVMSEDQISLASEHAEKISKKQAQKLESKKFSVASKDVPFQISKADEISHREDTTFIPIDKTTKNIATTKKMLIPKASKTKQEGKSFSSLRTGGFGEVGEEGLSSGRFGEGIGGIQGGGSGLNDGGDLGGSAEGSSEGEGGGGKYGGIFETSGGGYGKGAGGGWSSIGEDIREEEVISKKATEEEVIKRAESKGRALFEITGPLANREIISKVIPKYPEWAKRRGIDAAVSLHFVVLSNGKVKKNIYVQRTSGYPKFDQLVLESLSKWFFAPLQKKFYGKEQWGIITFYFYLK